MSHESAPAPIINPNGEVDETALRSQFGLGAEEANQIVTFGSYSGTVAEMLADPRCPVGGMLSESYQQEGIDGVVKRFNALGMMDSNFKVEVSGETLEMGRETYLKKNQTSLNP